MEVRVAHALTPDAAAARLADLAAAQDVELEPDGAGGRRIGKTTPLGAVRGRYAVEADAVVVTIEERPAFLPEGMVRRALEDELGRVLGDG